MIEETTSKFGPRATPEQFAKFSLIVSSVALELGTTMEIHPADFVAILEETADVTRLSLAKYEAAVPETPAA